MQPNTIVFDSSLVIVGGEFADADIGYTAADTLFHERVLDKIPTSDDNDSDDNGSSINYTKHSHVHVRKHTKPAITTRDAVKVSVGGKFRMTPSIPLKIPLGAKVKVTLKSQTGNSGNAVFKNALEFIATD